MRTATLPAALAALLALAACTPNFDGPEKIRSLRLLAIQAEPPELGAAADGSGAAWPAASATLRSLVAHPGYATDVGPQAIVLHLGCTPEPGDPSGTACTQMSELSQPGDLLRLVSLASACGEPGRGQVNAITFSGLEVCDRAGCGPLSVPLDPATPGTAVALPAPGYALPADFSLATLPAGRPQRVLGLDVVDLALVVEASPAEVAPATAVPDACAALGAVLQNVSARWTDRAHVAALKWIHVRGPDMPAESLPNHNPAIAGIALGRDGGQRVVALRPGFGAASFESLRERYQRYDTDGKLVDTRDETWAYSWFSIGGSPDRAHTDSTDPEVGYDEAKGTNVIWLVVRDLRGGEAWATETVEGQ